MGYFLPKVSIRDREVSMKTIVADNGIWPTAENYARVTYSEQNAFCVGPDFWTVYSQTSPVYQPWIYTKDKLL